MTKRRCIVTGLQAFMDTWLANPAARRDFARLISEVLQHPRHDHADEELLAWVSEQEETAKFLGIR